MDKSKKYFFLGLLGLVTFLFFKIIYPFLGSILFAFVFAHLLRSSYKFFKSISFPWLAAMLIVLLVCLIIFIPFIIISKILLGQVEYITESFTNMLPLLHSKIEYILNTPLLKPLAQDTALNLSETIFSQLDAFVAAFSQAILKILTGSIFSFFHLFVMLVLIFFLCLDGDKLVEKVIQILPMPIKEAEKVLNEAAKITDATLLSMLFIAFLEGAYGALIFKIFGMPAPLFWGVVMMFFSVVPIVGILAVLLPVGFFMAISGSFWVGIGIILMAYAGTTITQNIIKPVFVSQKGGLHPAVFLLATIGGIMLFGLLGFLLGPLVAILFVEFWRIYSEGIKT